MFIVFYRIAGPVVQKRLKYNIIDIMGFHTIIETILFCVITKNMIGCPPPRRGGGQPHPLIFEHLLFYESVNKKMILYLSEGIK
jgi:hypothetical protein